MQRIKKLIYVTILLFFVICCQSKSELREKEFQNVLTFLINKKALPLPPAPPLPNDTLGSWKIPKKDIDSLKKVKLNIAIYPNLHRPSISENFEIKNIPKDFKEIINQFYSIGPENYIPIDSINRNSKHNVILADTLLLKKSKDWKEYDLLFTFSNISFNKKLDKAALTLGISRSSLSGYGALYLLSKDDKNKWSILENYEFEVW